jgi:Delta14-sterol reductase
LSKATIHIQDTDLTMVSSLTNKQSTATKHFEYEFGGPIGALATVILLPFIVLLLSHWTNVGHVDLSFLQSNNNHNHSRFWDILLASPIFCPSCSNGMLLLQCIFAMAAWFLLQVLMERFLPCELVAGSPIQGDPNHRLIYRINGHLAFWATVVLMTVAWPYYDEVHQLWQLTNAPLTLIFDYHAELALATVILCYTLSTYLYVSSFGKDKILAHGGNSGNPIYDFFIGRELNPRGLGGTFDWKEFCELRPGLIGWMLLNASCAAKQHQTMGYVSGSMILVNIFQGVYVWDALYQEQAILTTMDITTDGFGFMLCFGDLAWVPFTYSVQAKYLVKHDPNLSTLALSFIIGVHMFGYFLFRGANSQKDAFRRNPDDPNVKHLKFLQTKRGTKLLTSGWWGMARKINYTGDFIMGLSWCMTCGFHSIVPYFYATYFAILLIHRSIRDDHMCQEKYGDDWQIYKKIVPYRFIPGIV